MALKRTAMSHQNGVLSLQQWLASSLPEELQVTKHISNTFRKRISNHEKVPVIIGAHCNPAFSLLFALRGILPWEKLPVYWLAQYLGALAGSAAVLGVYWGNVLLLSCHDFERTEWCHSYFSFFL